MKSSNNCKPPNRNDTKTIVPALIITISLTYP